MKSTYEHNKNHKHRLKLAPETYCRFHLMHSMKEHGKSEQNKSIEWVAKSLLRRLESNRNNQHTYTNI